MLSYQRPQGEEGEWMNLYDTAQVNIITIINLFLIYEPTQTESFIFYTDFCTARILNLDVVKCVKWNY